MAADGALSAEVIKKESGQYDLELVQRLRVVGASLRSVANLEGCVRLHTLDLSRNRLATVHGLEKCLALRTLRLAHNQLRELGQGLASLQRLEVFDARGNELGAAAAVAASLKKCGSLRTLSLRGPNGADTNPCCGDADYAKALRAALPRLETLDGARVAVDDVLRPARRRPTPRARMPRPGRGDAATSIPGRGDAVPATSTIRGPGRGDAVNAIPARRPAAPAT